MLLLNSYKNLLANIHKLQYSSFTAKVLIDSYRIPLPLQCNHFCPGKVNNSFRNLNNRLFLSNQWRHLCNEVKAVNKLVITSPYLRHTRNFHMSSQRYKNEGQKDSNKQDDEKNKMKSVLAKAFLWMLTGYMVIAILSTIFPNKQRDQLVRYISWNEFYHHMLSRGEVEQIIVRPDLDVVTIILHEGAVIKGRRLETRTFHMSVIDPQKFEDKLRNAEASLGIKEGIPITYERNADLPGKLFITILIGAVILSLLSRGKTFKPPTMDTFTQMGRAKFTLVDPVNTTGKGVLFKDVAGLQEAKQEVMEFVDYLKNPERYKTLGAKVPKGALLLGPPGCGKTMLAKAVATEAQVPFLSMNGSEFIEMIGGLGAARVRDLFKEAAKRAPCIIYIDEIDAIGRQRGGDMPSGGTGGPGSGESEQTLNQLLVEMDGMASTEGVLMLASTNRADVLDKALLRPGRFDRHIVIDLPNLAERKEIFVRHLSPITLEKTPEFYAPRLAPLTPGFSGADIANVCNEAALHAAKNKETQVTAQDLEYAVERVVGGTEKRTHAMSPGERKTVAYHEAGHALVGWLLKHTDALLKITIVPRTNLALGFAMYTPTDQKLFSKEELFERMCMALGGRVAESLTFNRITTGAQNDLEKVTKMAYAQVQQYGMSEAVGLVSFPEKDDGAMFQGKKPYSKTLATLIDCEVNNLVTKAYLKTEEVLKANKDKLELLAETLLKQETLNYADVEKLIGPPPYGPKKLITPDEFDDVTPLNKKENTDEKESKV